MCLAVPGRILSIENNRAIIEIGKMKREVFMHLVPEAKLGEYVIVHAGCAMQVLDEEEAEKTLELIREFLEDEIR